MVHYMYMFVVTHAMVHAWRSEDNIMELVFPFLLCVGSVAPTRVAKLAELTCKSGMSAF